MPPPFVVSGKRKSTNQRVYLVHSIAYAAIPADYGIDTFKRSVEELMRFLTDRRPKVKGALETLNITTLQAHEMPNLSAASVEDLYALPDIPLVSLSPEQLVRFAQIVDTALFKSYLLVRPGLLQSLCRSGNWCEISEVEEVLRSREVCFMV